MYKKVNSRNNFVEMEKNILTFWKEKNIIKQNFQMNEGCDYFTFYDGPPTANGAPHIGHVVTRVIKDLIPRYKVMKGYKVLRKAGWDTHGLPVELEVEKALGISGKPEIENYGVENFINKCKESVFTYASQWREMSERVAYWIDMDDPYITYQNNYIESVWWSLKQLWEKDLLYKGHKIAPYCPRCGTALSSHEVAQGYKEVTDSSAYVKFKIKGKPVYILAWTTTPWTLPGNVALAVNRKYDYVEVRNQEEKLILAEDLLGKLVGEYEIIRKFKGEELLEQEYEPLFSYSSPDKKAYYIIHADFVNLNDGTGVVHIAPAHGEDDYRVGQNYDLPLVNLVDAQGNFMEEVIPWKGIFVKRADEKIIVALKERKILYKAEKYLHSYPFCWRCDTPLLYYPRESWFVKMSSLRMELLENNERISWYPDSIKNGRFGNFLENVIDWGLSRERYWGTPLPIWECACGHRECVGSIAELLEKGIGVTESIELHKPYIDNVLLRCPKCSEEMKRVSEVIDCWYDSGSMPFAQYHFPFANKELFTQNFPAQFISEAVDQTRGWFYTLLAVSTAVFDKNPFEHCIVLGHVLDKNGIKMSKHKGNVLSPSTVLENEGADALRWYFYTASAPWLPSRFSEDAVIEVQRKFLNTLWNVYSFYVLYAEIDQFDPGKYQKTTSSHIMDKWIVSRLNTMIRQVDDKLGAYDINGAAKLLGEFTDELSNWYVRRNRTRYWTTEMTDDKINAYLTLYTVLTNLTIVAAPFVPFITEEIYQNLVVKINKKVVNSVHLCRWPACDETGIDEQLECEMKLAYKICSLGRSARNLANIKNRQPLSKMLLSSKALPDYYLDIIKEELNIKDIEVNANMSDYITYTIKPDAPVLGKTHGKFIPAIRKALSGMNQMELALQIVNGQSVLIDVNGTSIELNSDNLLVSMNGLEGFAFAGEGGLGVVLDTHITETLREEGYAREIISKIQNMRKNNSFEIMDQIKIYMAGNPLLQRVAAQYKEYIMSETLGVDIVFDEQKKYLDVTINGQPFKLAVEKE